MYPFFFIWKGKNSYADFGLYVKSFPEHVRPQERHQVVEIPGKTGSMTLLEGNDVYESYPANMVVIVKNKTEKDRIIAWLRGSGEMIVSNDLDKARHARIVGEVLFDWEGSLLVGTIPFLFQPYRTSRYPEQTDRITVTGASATIRNPGDVASRPKVQITGSGNNKITIGGMEMYFNGISGTIVVDCDAGIITKDGALWSGNGIYSAGDFWEIPVGSCTITQTGSMSIVIDPGWRWL